MPLVVQIRRFPGLRAVVGFAVIAAVAIAAQELGGTRRSGAAVMPIAAPAIAAAEALPPVAAVAAVAAPAEEPRCTLPPAPPAPPLPAGSITRIDATHYVIDRAAIDAVLSSGPLLRGARIIPVMGDGAPMGIRLYAVRPSSVYAAMGLRNGDTILTVDGLSIIHVDAALEVYQSVRVRAHHDVTLRRHGRDLTLHYAITDARTGCGT